MLYNYVMLLLSNWMNSVESKMNMFSTYTNVMFFRIFAVCGHLCAAEHHPQAVQCTGQQVLVVPLFVQRQYRTYSVIQSVRKIFCGYVVLDSIDMTFGDENKITLIKNPNIFSFCIQGVS